MSVILYWQDGQDIPFFPFPEREAVSAQLSREVKSAFGIEQSAGFVLNATILETHKVVINYTENPVEKGRFVTDHSYKMPDELDIEILISNDSGSFLGGGVIEGLLSDQIYSKDCFEYLEQLASQNVLLVIETPLKVYENMTIREISVDKSIKNANALAATINFKQVSFAYSSETDPIKPAPEKPVNDKEKNKTKPQNNKGKKTAVAAETKQPNEVEKWVATESGQEAATVPGTNPPDPNALPWEL